MKKRFVLTLCINILILSCCVFGFEAKANHEQDYAVAYDKSTGDLTAYSMAPGNPEMPVPQSNNILVYTNEDFNDYPHMYIPGENTSVFTYEDFNDYPHIYVPDEDMSFDDIINMLAADNRQRVTDTMSSNTYQSICFLEITIGNTTGYATGFLIDDKRIVTAGHCLYDPFLGGWANNINVYPAKNDTSNPYGSFRNFTTLTVGGSWYNNRDINGDFGAIKMASSIYAGRLGLYGGYSDSDLRITPITLTGYMTEDKPFGTMWRSHGTIINVSQFMLYHNAYCTRGSSG